MGLVLRSTVLLLLVLLTACAGSGVRDRSDDLLQRPDAMGPRLETSSQPRSPTDPDRLSGPGNPPNTEPGSARLSQRPQQTSPEGRQTGGVGWRVSADDRALFDAGVLYAMAYFPAPSGVRTERSNSLAALYTDARAGYGLYSFLLGGPVDARSRAEVAGYAELLRAIETYVIHVKTDDAADGAVRHGFLIQVDPARADDEIYAQVMPGLSLQIQSALARQLRLFGHLVLADRLEASTGPFLVTSLRPSLIPVDKQQPLLVVDLGQIGPEYMYSLVDAYDRPIPSDLRGRPESLTAIAQRLQQMFPSRQVDRAASPPPQGGWIWLIGVPGQSGEATPVARRMQTGGEVAGRQRQTESMAWRLGDLGLAKTLTGEV